MHAVVAVVVPRQDAVQVEVEDVGVEAADLQVVLEETERGQRSGQVGKTLLECFANGSVVLK